MQKLLIIGFCLTTISCNEGAKEISKRSTIQSLQADNDVKGEQPTGVEDTIVDNTVQNFSGITLSTAANFEQFQDFENISLISKIDQNTIVLFGSDGFSWSYGDAAGLQDNLPRLNPSEYPERKIYTLPDDDLWMVSSTLVSKRKFVDDAEENQIVLLNFDLTKLSGNRESTRVLGITKESLILEMGNYIGLFSVINGVASAYELKAELPYENVGAIVSSGQTNDGGYWFLTSEKKFVLLKRKEQKWVWNLVEMPVTTFEDEISSMAIWLDVENKAVSGDAAILTTNSLLSISGAPIAVLN